MWFLTAVTLFIGIMYGWMGVAIRFFGEYKLVNNYDADVKAGKFGPEYAKRVGSISLVGALLCAGAAVVCLCDVPGLSKVGSSLGCVLLSLVLFRINYVRSDKSRG